MAKYPAGYRFVPTDEELLDYLKMRIRNHPIPVTEVIRDANVYACDPQKLIAEIFPGERKEGGYFFTPRDRKYPNGSRPNRKAGNGYWKATGADQKIKNGNEILGHKRALNYLIGEQSRAQKTRWIMHEYTLPGQLPRVKQNERDMRLNDWVLCHIYQRALRKSDNQDYEEVPVDTPAATDAHYTTAMVPVPEQLMMPEAFNAESRGVSSAGHGTNVEAHCTTATEQLDGFGNLNNWLLDQPYNNGEGTYLTNYYQPPAGYNGGEGTSSSYYRPPLGDRTMDGSSYGASRNYDEDDGLQWLL